MTALLDRARLARAASRTLAATAGGDRDAVLRHAAAGLRAATAEILEVNGTDVEGADVAPALLARLKLDEHKVEDMAAGLESLAELPDPLGRVDLRRELDEGLTLTRFTVPIGVIGIVFESRPDAAVQIAGLGIKSGNGVLLKGGREALGTVRVLVRIMRDALAHAGLNADAVQQLEDRSEVDELLSLSGDVDLIIPRGSNALVRSIQERTRIPVLGHAEGICHVYVDAAADLATAVRVVHDAKVQYPAACNAVETLLVHRQAGDVLRAIAADLGEAGVELRGDEEARRLVEMNPATDADWDTEYGGPILAVKVVSDLDEALAHIAEHGSAHTEVIVTTDDEAADRFLTEVDAAGVYLNASSRFADGYRYGFGAEVGISTGRIHARGPVGLEGLVTSKYVVIGDGHVVADYTGAQAKRFTHRDLPAAR